ncbi:MULTISPECIES: CU044_2847 family protein [Actinomadura]|uniref:CU044_2847 family protein n=1 Tax=Actinomadura yumaensis TaxID=111807 RepID=A0ABW2CQI1_9ACTN|nr:CU044_2847 family protein [Actinomadura sp. J1-007]MWK37320.1 hypothetical protein [Actinomadura sp. J1-007]
MAERTEFLLESGGTVIVETAERPGVGPAGRVDRAVERAGRTLRESLDTVAGAAGDIMAAFGSLPARPEEVEVQFGVGLDASFSTIVAETTGRAHLHVTLRWRPEADGDAEPA